jgi:hypothetical protein
MTSATIELVERVRRRLAEHESPFAILGPTSEARISAAEEALGCTFPPSYRDFLRTFGGIAIPPHLGVVHDFVGVAALAPSGAEGALNGHADQGADHRADQSFGVDVVGHTLRARAERHLAEHLVVVGIGAQHQEWFCLDLSRQQDDDGECPVLLFDARDNAVDQIFYQDFGEMLEQVLGFVADNLDQPLD